VTADCVLSSDHSLAFAAVVQRGRVSGAQFHPERSAAVGARLLRNFLGQGLA
jgi:glutamine amidotransferase